MQLSHTVSPRKHYPTSFLTLCWPVARAFITEPAPDRWPPGTHQQRIKEIKVEVLIEGSRCQCGAIFPTTVCNDAL